MTYLCVWLIFWRRSAIKLNYFRGLYEKTTQMCSISKQKLMYQTKIWSMIFLKNLKDLSIGRLLSGKKMELRGYFLRKQKLCMQNLTKVWKQPPIVILQQAIFYNRFILRLWQRIIRRTDQGVQFMNSPSQIFFNNINHGCRAAILKKYLRGCFGSIWLWLLIPVTKRCAERCALQLYRTSIWVDIITFLSQYLSHR